MIKVDAPRALHQRKLQVLQESLITQLTIVTERWMGSNESTIWDGIINISSYIVPAEYNN